MTPAAPGKAFRQGLTIFDLMEMFPTGESARERFEGIIWAGGRTCPHCGSGDTFGNTVESADQPHRRRSCQQHFSVRIGTVMERSRLPRRKGVLAIHPHMTSLKGVSSMKLHRDIGVTQKTAWFMLQRIREAFRRDDDDNDPMGGGRMGGPVEVDGTRMGGKRKNMPKSKREAMTGRGGAGKSIVVGAKDRETGEVRAEAVPSTDRSTLQGLVADHACPDAEVRTDERSACAGMPFDHRTVSHSPGEHVRDLIHTNGIESFRSMFKRARKGVYHKMSPKHLHRHVTDFAGRQTVRKRSTLPQMQRIADGMIGRRLECRRLIADNGLWNGADGCVPA